MPYKWQLRSMFVIRHCITITWNVNECGIKLLYINLEILKKNHVSSSQTALCRYY
jgi:hypothetical protein